MSRPPVTVAVLVGADRQATRGFLALLGATLAPSDDVVLVGPGRDPSSPGSWRAVRGRKLVRLQQRGRLHEAVVVLDERAVPAGPWLDPLVRALADPKVGGAAARSNVAGGDELLVPVPYRPDEPDAHRALVRRLASGRAGTCTTVEHLGGPSLAVRRPTLEHAGGLASLLGATPMARLVRAAARDGRLVVAEGSYLHHAGGPGPRPAEAAAGPRPFVSACLITKDEHDNLPRCLASTAGFADEVVVYDTGSTDDTRELARAHGATVVDGYWDGDFARARNACLEHCTGQWVLWLDADEALACDDPAGLRLRLAELSSDIEALVVLIDNLRGNRASTALTHPACRLFRRACGRWTGRLHEQVTPRAGAGVLSTRLLDGVRITHWGYLHAAVDGRDKGQRNIRSAFGDLAADVALPWATRLTSLGRSYGLADQRETGLALCRAAADAADTAEARRHALRAVIDNLLALDRAEEALAVVAQLRAVSTSPLLADTEEGHALLRLERYEEALAAFDRVTDGLDDDGYQHTAHGLAAGRASALFHLERHGEAADVLLAGLRASGGMDLHVGLLVECLERAGRPFDELAQAVPAERSTAFLGQLLQLDPELADRVLDAWYGASPTPAVLATASCVAPALGVGRQRAWSERLRSAGLASACPLVTSAGNATRPVPDRLLAAATALVHFGDPRGHPVVAALSLQVPAEERAGCRRRLADVAPDLLELFDALGPAASGDTTGGGADDSHSDPAPRPAPEGGRRVLVVDRHVAALRTLALARRLRRSGHQVTLAHPQPAAQTEDLLASRGVVVRGWAQGPGDDDWRLSLREHVARCYASAPVDTVVLADGTAPALGDIRAVVPGAHVVTDLDYGPAAEIDHGPSAEIGGSTDIGEVRAGGRPGVPDLYLAAHEGAAGGPTGAPVSVVADSTTGLFPPPPPVPEHLRRGICVVGDFRAAGQGELARWGGVARALCVAAPFPIVVVGDDPGNRVADSMPGAVPAGPLADPRPWLATARVVVVVTAHGAAHWLGAAAMCGTPALLVPTDEPSLGQLAPALAALADPAQVELWTRFAPPAPSVVPPRSDDDDPLAVLPAPRSRRASRLSASAGGAPDVRRGGPTAWGGPQRGRRVVELEWPYGGLPAEWVGALRDMADEALVPSQWAADHAAASGVDPGVVRVVLPVGVDTETFAPHGDPLRLGIGAATTLLFVGDADEQHGVDALLEAYLTTFGATDGVCLAMHLTDGGDGALGADVRAAARHRGARGPILLLEGLGDAETRAAAYRACAAVVAPFRAPRTVRPVVEAMACGLPVVAPEIGPVAALCDDRSGWPVGCREVPVNARALGVTPTAHGLWQVDPDRAGLAAALRAVVDHPEQRLRKGLAARDRISTADDRVLRPHASVPAVARRG